LKITKENKKKNSDKKVIALFKKTLLSMCQHCILYITEKLTLVSFIKIFLCWTKDHFYPQAITRDYGKIKFVIKKAPEKSKVSCLINNDCYSYQIMSSQSAKIRK